MALQTRITFLYATVMPNGDVQKWTRTDVYDDKITPVAHVSVTFNKDGTIKTPEIEAVSDVHTLGKKHCDTIYSSDETPADVQAFLDNSKA